MAAVQLRRKVRRPVLISVGAAAAALLLGACVGESSPLTGLDGNDLCALNPAFLASGGPPPDGIPALTLPEMVPADAIGGDEPNVSYLFDSDRVLGVVVNGEARAYPHKVLWYHEIVNDSIGDRWVSVTFCPLTGSGLAFDPHIGERRLDLGVSGLLFGSNLIMYDRLTGELYGPQMHVEGRCQSFRDKSLSLMPVQEMSWRRWKQLHPDTWVIGVPGSGAAYQTYPYGAYDDLGYNDVWFPSPLDPTRPAKERVLMIRVGDGGRGYPFGELASLGETGVMNEVVAGIPTVVFYESADGETAVGFDARVNGEALTFETTPDGGWTDLETGSTWGIDGTAIDGQHAGAQLEPRADAYVVFWFAWRHFQPEGSTFRR